MVLTTAVGPNEYSACGCFDDMDLPNNLLRGIYAYGFERPSPVQQRVIRPVAHGRDIVCHSKSGTGKAASCMIGSLARIDFNVLACQALVLAPTREFAMNLYGLVRALGEYLQARCSVCVGGTSWRDTADNLRQGQHLVVGTPGRVLDAIHRRFLHVEHLKLLVLHEADELLARGFEDHISDVFQVLNPEVQVCLFSATLPQELLDLAWRSMRHPVRILGESDERPTDERPTIAGIRQYYIVAESEDSKLQLLTDLFQRGLRIIQGVVYCNTLATADAIARALQAINFTSSVMHGGLSHQEWQLAQRQFGMGSSRVLIATQPLAPSCHLYSVSVTINYDLPEDMEDYSRRIGCSGRFGRGVAIINLVSSQTVQAVRDIEQHYSANMEELPADLPADIADLVDSSEPHRSVQRRRLDGLSNRVRTEAAAPQPVQPAVALLKPRAAT